MRKMLSTLALAAGTALACSPVAAAITLSFTPDKTHVAVGESVTIAVGVGGLGAEVLSGFDLNFLYNPGVLTFANYSYGAAPLGAQTALNALIAPGDLGFDVVSLEDDATLTAAQADSFTLFTFVLAGGADGATNFSLGSDPDFQRLFSGLGFNPLTVDVGNVCVSVGTGSCSVPEPGTYGLVGVAMLGAMLPGALRRRRRA